MLRYAGVFAEQDLSRTARSTANEEKLSEILQTRARGAADTPKPTALELLLRRAWLVAGELDGKTFGEREKELERLSAHLRAMQEVHTEMKMTADRRLRPRLSDLVRWLD